MAQFFESWITQQLKNQQEKNLFRQLRECKLLPSGKIVIGQKECWNFSSNDYLGLATRLLYPKLDYGSGSGGSRLVCGNHSELIALEKELAELHHSDSALVFGSGYLANVGIISAFADRETLIFSDRLNHASIIDGILLSHAHHVRYYHNDMEHLEYLLTQHKTHPKKIIVTDAIFSMDGDCVSVTDLVRIKNDYDALLILDEAHSDGVWGDRGEGLAASQGLGHEVDIHMGTLSKAYGCYGAFVTCRKIYRDYLVNFCRTLIYSTALPPFLVRMARLGVEEAIHAQEARQKITLLSNLLRDGLQRLGFSTGKSASQIVPMIVGEASEALAWSRYLEEEGVFAVAIRPPTVPKGTARLRFSITAHHSIVAIQETLAKIEKRLQSTRFD